MSSDKREWQVGKRVLVECVVVREAGPNPITEPPEVKCSDNSRSWGYVTFQPDVAALRPAPAPDKLLHELELLRDEAKKLDEDWAWVKLRALLIKYAASEAKEGK